jgi:hypothetical protein
MAVITMARGGDSNPWTTICAVFGGVYVIALAVFRRWPTWPSVVEG